MIFWGTFSLILYKQKYLMLWVLAGFNQKVLIVFLFLDFFFFFFFFDLGLMALSRIFHLYRAYRSSKVGENLKRYVVGTH